MARLLLITTEVKAEIVVAIINARKMPVPLDVVRAGAGPQHETTIMLADRPPGFTRPRSERVEIPYGYVAAFSFEEQPAGLVRHLSISVDGPPGACPSVEAVVMIAREFGIEWSPDNGGDARVWLEEFEPGNFAVNLVAIVDGDQPRRTVQ